MTIGQWVILVKAVAEKYGVDPNFALAVFECESSKKEVRFRFGKVGKYWLPAGIHQCFESRWDLSDLRVNTEVGIRALARYGKDYRRSLKRYNASFDESYYKRIMGLTKKNREDPKRWQ